MVRKDPAVIAAYLGEEEKEVAARRSAAVTGGAHGGEPA